MVAEVAESIGLPPGVLNVVTADREVSELLVRDPRVDKITFTGSTAGRSPHRLAVRRADRPVHPRAGGQVGGGDPRRHRPGRGRRPRWPRPSASSPVRCAPRSPGSIVSRPRHDELVEALAGTLRHRSGSATRSIPSRRWARWWPNASATGCSATWPRASPRAPRWSPAVAGRPISIGAGSSSRRCSPTSTTRRPSPRRRSSGRCSRSSRRADEQDAVRLANDTIYGLNASVFTDDVDRARRGRRSAPLGDGGPQRLPHRLRHRLRRLQAVGDRSRGRAPRGCCRSWSPRRSSWRARRPRTAA